MREIASLPAYIRETANVMCTEKQLKVSENYLSDVSAVYSGSRAFVKLQPHKAERETGPRFLFDTGAQVSLITPADFTVFKRHHRVRREVHVMPNVANASGGRMKTDGVYDIQFFLRGSRVTVCLSCQRSPAIPY